MRTLCSVRDDLPIPVRPLDDGDAFPVRRLDAVGIPRDNSNIWVGVEKTVQNLLADAARGSGNHDHMASLLALDAHTWRS